MSKEHPVHLLSLTPWSCDRTSWVPSTRLPLLLAWKLLYWDQRVTWTVGILPSPFCTELLFPRKIEGTFGENPPLQYLIVHYRICISAHWHMWNMIPFFKGIMNYDNECESWIFRLSSSMLRRKRMLTKGNLSSFFSFLNR